MMLHKLIERRATALRVGGRCVVAGRWAGLALVSACVLASAPAAADGVVDGVAAAPAQQLAALSPTPPGRNSSSGLAAAALSEPALRQAVLDALWPRDIARLAADYLARFPQQPFAAEAAELQRRARPAAEALRHPEVQLFRTAFNAAAAHDDGALLRQAALGDGLAALTLAQRSLQRSGEGRRGVGWLQLASQLGSEQAAYALALHYRREGQPLLAAQYEARALALGFEPPPTLDHRRN